MKKALSVTALYIEKVATDLENQYIFIMHSDREEYANILRDKLESIVKCKKIFVSDVFSGCGTNIGAGMICAYFMGNPITPNLETEKLAMDEAVKEILNSK